MGDGVNASFSHHTDLVGLHEAPSRVVSRHINGSHGGAGDQTAMQHQVLRHPTFRGLAQFDLRAVTIRHWIASSQPLAAWADRAYAGTAPSIRVRRRS